MRSIMLETLAVTPVGIVRGAGMKLGLATVGHNQNVAEVAVSSAAEMGVAETHDAAVSVLIAGTIVVDTRLVYSIDVVGNGVGVGTELYKAVRIASTREGMAHAVGADKDIHMARRTLRHDSNCQAKQYGC